MTAEEIMRDIMTRPTVPLWPHVGYALDTSRNKTYAAAKQGDIDIIEIGRCKRAITASLRRRLGIEPSKEVA